jgi:hypothetical protein
MMSGLERRGFVQAATEGSSIPHLSSETFSL